MKKKKVKDPKPWDGIEITESDKIEIHAEGYPNFLLDSGNALRLDIIKKDIERLIRNYGPDARLSLDSGYNNITSKVSYKRLETDKETKRRLYKEKKEEEKAQKRSEEERKRELQLLKDLKKKYPNEFED